MLQVDGNSIKLQELFRFTIARLNYKKTPGRR